MAAVHDEHFMLQAGFCEPLERMQGRRTVVRASSGWEQRHTDAGVLQKHPSPVGGGAMAATQPQQADPSCSAPHPSLRIHAFAAIAVSSSGPENHEQAPRPLDTAFIVRAWFAHGTLLNVYSLRTPQSSKRYRWRSTSKRDIRRAFQATRASPRTPLASMGAWSLWFHPLCLAMRNSR